MEITYKQQVEELKYKWKQFSWINNGNSGIINSIKKQAQALKAKIEAEGCGEECYHFDHSFTCGYQAYCSDCQEAIKELDEMLK